MADILYKWLKADGTSHYQDYQWPLPKNGTPGKWVRATGKLVLCGNEDDPGEGIHACSATQVAHHISDTLWEMESRGKLIMGEDKLCVSAGRLLRRLDGINEQTLRLFAADCAERVLPLFEKQSLSDKRPRNAILASRQFAFGVIDAAARAAAFDAAWAAAEAAAGAAARDVARAAAWAAAREWQSARLLEYAYGRVDLDAIKESVTARVGG